MLQRIRRKSVWRPTIGAMLRKCSISRTPVSWRSSVASLNEQARGTQRLGKLGLDPRRLPARNMLQMQGWPSQNLQTPPEHAAGRANTGLVLIEPIGRAVMAHPDVDAMRIRAAVTVVEQHQIDVRTSAE